MGPTWALSASDGPHVVPMNIAIREIACQITSSMQSAHTHYHHFHESRLPYCFNNVIVPMLHRTLLWYKSPTQKWVYCQCSAYAKQSWDVMTDSLIWYDHVANRFIEGWFQYAIKTYPSRCSDPEMEWSTYNTFLFPKVFVISNSYYRVAQRFDHAW